MSPQQAGAGQEVDLVRWLASRDLPGCTELNARELDSDAAHQLISIAETARLLGPMTDAVTSGELVIESAAAELLNRRHAAVMAWCVLIEARLLEVRAWFEEIGGVQHRVIKGSAVAHLDEVDPAMRSFADLDLLVAAEDLDRAVDVLERRGAVRPWPQRRPGFDRRFAKSVTLTGSDGIELDLHRTLCDGVHGVRIPVDELFGAADVFDLAGEAVPALSRPHRMLHAAYHAVLGSPTPRLLSLRDIARYMALAEMSPETVVPIARRWRGEAVLAAAVAVALDGLDFDAPEWAAWLAAFEPDPAEQELILRQQREGSSIGRGKVDMLREIPGIADKVAYARAVIWPTSAHLAARGLRRSDVLRALARAGGHQSELR